MHVLTGMKVPASHGTEHSQPKPALVVPKVLPAVVFIYCFLRRLYCSYTLPALVSQMKNYRCRETKQFAKLTSSLEMGSHLVPHWYCHQAYCYPWVSNSGYG